MFKELMASFAERIGLEEPIEIDEDGFCSFDVADATVGVQGMDELEMLSLSADVGAPPPECLEQLYKELLKANHHFRGTKGATLSIDPQTDSVHICRYAPYSALVGDRMDLFVLDFINTLLDWRSRVRDFRTDKSANGDSSPGNDLLKTDGAFVVLG